MAATSQWLRTLGVIHYTLGALCTIAFVLTIAGMFWVTTPSPSVPASADSKFGIGVAEITLGIVAICFVGLSTIAFLLGNRLYCRRWRVFCLVMAVAELLWSFAAGAVAGTIFFTELYTQDSNGAGGTIMIAVLSAMIPGIPVLLAIITLIFLGLPSAAASFAPIERR